MTREEILAVAKPILFNTEMVCKVLDGTKSATRRVVKPQPFAVKQDKTAPCWCGHFVSESGKVLPDKPPYCPGDILYVRETWRRQPLKWSREGGYSDFVFQYRADFTDEENGCYGRRGGIAPQKWHPSIHMPKEAARIFLRVTDVRVERLQDILDDPPGPECQIVKEGCKYACDFSAIWDTTIKPADRTLYGWDANPWVWVIEFEKLEAEK